MLILCLAHNKQLLLYFKDFLLVFGFLWFEYDMARYRLFGIYPSCVSRTAWIYGLVSVINCGKFSVTVTSAIFSAPFSLSSSDIPIMWMLYLLQLSHNPWILCSFFFFLFFFSLCISVLGSFYWHIFQLTDSFLGHVQFTISSSKTFFISVTVFLISSISFWFFLRASISLLMIPIYSCMLSTFSIRAISILITIILSSWSDHSKVCTILESSSDACFVSSDCGFSCLLEWLVIFCWKLDMMCWVIGTEIGFMLICLGIRLCLL